MYKEVNKILSDWDPIGVGAPLSSVEYSQYVPEIISLITNPCKLESYLIEIIKNMGLSYNPNDSSQRADIQKVIQMILSVKE